MVHDETTRIGLAAGLGLVAAAGNLLGGYFVVRRDWPRQYLNYFVALGAGYMLAVAFTDVIPESVRLAGNTAYLFVLIGYFLVHLFEHTLAPHFHFGEETHLEEMRFHHAHNTIFFGLAIHTFFDGVSIAAAFLVNFKVGFLVFIAILLHKMPEGFTVASIMLASGRSAHKALLATLAIGAATLAGVIGVALLQEKVSSAVAYALPFSAGVTLYVAASDLIPEVNHEEERNPTVSIVVFVGVALFYLLHRLIEG